MSEMTKEERVLHRMDVEDWKAARAELAAKDEEIARLREALELIAAPMRPDGTWNRCREACRQLAAEALQASTRPVPIEINCPQCSKPHLDEGEWATRPHKTHQCQHCGHEWRPFEYATVGVSVKTSAGENS